MGGNKTIDNYGNFLKEIAVKALGDYFGKDTWDGSKFWGSLGPVSEWTFVDYWKLRKRSMKLFRTNLYAKGVIRRLVWNEIHTGIIATPTPMGSVLFPSMDEVEREQQAVKYGEEIAVKTQEFAFKRAEKEIDRATYQAMEALIHIQIHPLFLTGAKKRLSEHSRNL